MEKLKQKKGQVMILSVVILGGILLSASAIAGVLMIYQIRSVNDSVNSAKAVFAADAGIEAASWCTLKPNCPWGDFTEAPFSFDDSTVTFNILRRSITSNELQIVSQGLAAQGGVVRVLETIFVTE